MTVGSICHNSVSEQEKECMVVNAGANSGSSITAALCSVPSKFINLADTCHIQYYVASNIMHFKLSVLTQRKIPLKVHTKHPHPSVLPTKCIQVLDQKQSYEWTCLCLRQQ